MVCSCSPSSYARAARTTRVSLPRHQTADSDAAEVAAFQSLPQLQWTQPWTPPALTDQPDPPTDRPSAATQWRSAHASPAAHDRLHPPQWPGSLMRSTQTPAQTAWPAVQIQTPRLQRVPAQQRRPSSQLRPAWAQPAIAARAVHGAEGRSGRWPIVRVRESNRSTSTARLLENGRSGQGRGPRPCVPIVFARPHREASIVGCK